MRPLLFASLLLAVPHLAAAADETDAFHAEFEQHVQPFLREHCVRCHNADEMTSGVRVDQLDAAPEGRALRLWDAVLRQLAAEKMPPADEPQPNAEHRQRVAAWITRVLDDARSRPDPKNGSVRRLTVSQYRNTLRDLLSIDEELTEVLPPDGISREGFDNNQAALELSPLLLETYFEIAERALDICLADPQATPRIQALRMELGAGINPNPCPDDLILGANSLLLANSDFVVTQPVLQKPFEYEPIRMRTQYRFIEGYQGNDTVRGWREYDSIYHAVFACMRGTEGYPLGQAYSTVPEGLLLRPAIPSQEEFGVESTYGPSANFKVSLRELPEHGRFRVTVTAAKYEDGLLLEAGTPEAQAGAGPCMVCRQPALPQTVMIEQSGVYQVDVFGPRPGTPEEKTGPEADAPPTDNAHDLTLVLGDRQFHGVLQQPAFLVVRLAAGELTVGTQAAGTPPPDRVVLTLLPDAHPLHQRFTAFERRVPRLGVHLGLRRDCGSTLNPVGNAQPVDALTLSDYVFEGAIRNFPSPDVEPDNENYLAGIREIGVRSEYTDGRDMPRLLIRAVQFEGPFLEAWPPPAHRNLLIDSDLPAESPEYAEEIIHGFAGRAFRRPVTDSERAALQQVFDQSRSEGHSFVDSVRHALQVILTSPQFLCLIERSSSPEPEPLDDYELASKLSYFLWNSPPDHHLLQAAAAGRLSDQPDREVERMIADPRSRRFVSEFAAQWLSLDRFDVLEPDRERFPRLTRDVRQQLRAEPVEYVWYLIRRNLPVAMLLRSDVIVANEVVADYYDLGDRTESGFGFVPIDHQRKDLGGVLTQAAILAGLSDGREPNPVKRGAWLARRIIAEPPEDPPPNVPALGEDTTHLPLRERLERHRSQPGCAECHSGIDPWGIPFEDYDAGGRRRTDSVDAHSVLPDHTSVTGMDDLRSYLAEDRIDQVAFSVMMHLATWASGRSLTWNETEYLKVHGRRLKQDGYRFQDLIRFVVSSPLFLEK